jgi:hypothetical protein
VECIIDGATQLSPDQQAATELFTAAARTLQEAGVRRMVVVSIIGCDRFTAGYYAAKGAHERAHLSGPIPVRMLRAAQFHEFVGLLVEWGRQDGVSYVSKMRTHQVVARTVAQALAELATGPESASAPASSGVPIQEIAGPREESLVEMAKLLVARHGEQVRIEGVSGFYGPADPDRELYESGALLPRPEATLAGPTFEEWLDSTSRVVITDKGGNPRRGRPGRVRASHGEGRDDRDPTFPGSVTGGSVEAAVAGAFLEEWRRLVATLIRTTGDWDLAEECAQGAFEKALKTWPRDGVPTTPRRVADHRGAQPGPRPVEAQGYRGSQAGGGGVDVPIR